MFVISEAKMMAADVQNTLVKIAMEHGKKTEEAGKQWLKDLRSTGRFQEDVW
jgi:NADPH-ferrihemoprotein reductase